MSELIDSLTNIEDAANKIASSADKKKKQLGIDYKQMTLDFDEQLKSQTRKKLDFLKEEFDNEVLEEQTKLQKVADKELMKLNDFYSNHLPTIVDRLFNQIVEVDDV